MAQGSTPTSSDVTELAAPDGTPGTRPRVHAGPTAGPRPRADARGLMTRVAPGAAATALYLGLAVLLYHRVLFASSTSMPDCNCGDQAQEVWFLRWPLYAVSHGLNPFLSTWMNYPKGVNLAINTSSPLLGLASAPLQLTLGAVGAFDVLLVLAVATSALAMCLALRRWVRSWPAAFVGGLLYGFSPYMFGQGRGHLFLVAVFIPPIVLVLLDEIVVVQRHGAIRYGLLLGVLLALQYYVSPEVLAMTVVVACCGVAVLAVARPRTVVDRVPHVAVAVACGAAVGAAALAYPVWLSMHGPQHVVGPPHPVAGLAGFQGDLLGPLLPTSYQLVSPAFISAHGNVLVGGNVAENGMYLGIPLVVVVAVFAWIYRRNRALLFFAAMLVVAAILALGPFLVVQTRHTGIPLPAWILQRIPLLQDILDVRFSLFMQMATAAVLAIGLEELARAKSAGRGAWIPYRSRGPSAAAVSTRGDSPLRRLAVLGAPALVAIVALVPLVPESPYLGFTAHIPAFFTSPAVDRIPAGSAALTYPYPLVADAEWNLTFQAVAGMRFKVFGGDAFFPDGPGGTSVSIPTPLAPSVVEHLFSDAYTPVFAKTQLRTPPTTPTPPIDRSTVLALRTFLGRYHVSTVVVEHFGLSPHKVVRYVSDAIGRPQKTGGAWVWFHVQRRLGRRNQL